MSQNLNGLQIFKKNKKINILRTFSRKGGEEWEKHETTYVVSFSFYILQASEFSLRHFQYDVDLKIDRIVEIKSDFFSTLKKKYLKKKKF